MDEIIIIIISYPVGTISPQRIVVWQFLGPTYEEIGMKCAVINLT